MGLTTPARNPALSLPSIDAAIRAIRQEYPELRRTPFTNLVQNGGFDASLTGWTQTGNNASNFWAWSSGTARCVSDGTYVSLSQAILIPGARFALGLDVAVTVGGIKIASANTGLQDDIATNINASTSYSSTFTALSDTLYFGRFPGTADVTIDNVSLWEADPTDNEPWLRLPYGHRVMQGDQMHPLASVQRDADLLHAVDFTEIWRNGQGWIKPTVAPGVSTRFSVVSYKAI